MNNALEKIKIDSILSSQEIGIIEGLNFASFEGDKDEKAFKNGLNETKIQIDGVEGGMTFLDIAEQFDEYVEKGDDWKLKIKEGKESVPSRITNIVGNPKNNDLAFFVQKIAEIIEYQTAKKYTDNQLDVVMVGVDKTFGNQTRRALKGLKERILSNDDNKEGSKYVSSLFIDGLLSEKTTEEEKNEALDKFNLKYKDGEVMPKDGYEFLDSNSSNLAVKKEGGEISENDPENGGEYEENAEEEVVDIEQSDKNRDYSKGLAYSVSEAIKKVNFDKNIKVLGKELKVDFNVWHFDKKYKIEFSVDDPKYTKHIPGEKLLGSDGNIDQNLILKEKEVFRQELLAKLFVQQLRGQTYSKSELFGDDLKNMSTQKQGQLNNYFDLFKNSKIEIEGSSSSVRVEGYYTYSEGDKIYLWLDDNLLDENYHMPHNNEDLTFDAKSIADDDGNIDKEKLKKKMKDIVLNIIETHF